MRRPAQVFLLCFVSLLGLQLAGVLRGDGACAAVCDSDEDGPAGCPPFCPDCACTHRAPVGAFFAPAPAVGPALRHRLASFVPVADRAGRVLPGGLFRPPRV